MSEPMNGTDENIHRMALTPLLSLCEMQQDLFRLNVAASVEFSRRMLELVDTRVETRFPKAPVQVLAFYRDCASLAFAPLTLMAAANPVGPLAWQEI
ncbi:MAG: hypothetical protein KDG52_10425 [Rhodocyclaceae bacterium]|nr:hypothetical protein [Rhodocyclaceae bacterium]